MSANLKSTLVSWIAENTKTAKGLLVPVSGGSDSAVLFSLCREAAPEKTTAVYAGSKETLRCRDWLEGVGPISYLSPSEESDDPELSRWLEFIKLSRSQKARLVGSRNRSEDVMGSYSLSSRMVTYLPLGGLWKYQVMELAAFIGVPAEILESSRKADPDCGRPQELAEIPLESLDLFLRVKVGELAESELKALTTAQIEYIEKLYQSHQFRKTLPLVGPKV
ncbi:MAG: hypothetical protein K2W82_11185 [Candidatus Obscuribacterales bacterium]|nr:hypothetical protein [Candidatus Obscuribacterales bacterium]